MLLLLSSPDWVTGIGGRHLRLSGVKFHPHSSGINIIFDIPSTSTSLTTTIHNTTPPWNKLVTTDPWESPAPQWQRRMRLLLMPPSYLPHVPIASWPRDRVGSSLSLSLCSLPALLDHGTLTQCSRRVMLITAGQWIHGDRPLPLRPRSVMQLRAVRACRETGRSGLSIWLQPVQHPAVQHPADQSHL